MIRPQSISVKHNVEMAHRLFLTPGKCDRIHGHSFQVELTLTGPVDRRGMVAGMDFGVLKTQFRGYLDHEYDHRVLLNREDPFAGPLHFRGDTPDGWIALPGLQVFDGDPTTENFAREVGEWSLKNIVYGDIIAVEVDVWETAVNHANWNWLSIDE